MNKSAEYRLYAKERRLLAESLTPGNAREQLLAIAVEWEKLADDHDRRFGFVSRRDAVVSH